MGKKHVFFRQALALLLALLLGVMGLAACGGESAGVVDPGNSQASNSADAQGPGEASSNDGSYTDDAGNRYTYGGESDVWGNETYGPDATDANGSKVTGTKRTTGSTKPGQTTTSGKNSQGGATTKTTAVGSKTTQGGGSPGNTVTVSIWNLEDNLSMLTAAAVYESSHKNVKIQIINHTVTTLNDLKMALSANNAPDVVYMDCVYLGSAGGAGYLQDLNQYGAQSHAGKFLEAAWKGSQLDGKQYGMPFDTNTQVQVYNKDMLAAANAKVPTTYQELRETCDKIRTQYPSSYGYTHPFTEGDAGGDNWIAFMFFNWLWRMGGDILSADNKQATFNSEAGVQALQMLLDMKTSMQMSPAYMQREMLNNGSNTAAIMILHYSMNYPKLFGTDKKLNYGVSVLPVLKEGVPPYSGLGLHSYGVTSSSKNAKEAYDFISFYTTSSTYQVQFCKSNNYLPSLKDAHSDAYYQQPEWQVMLEQMKYIKARPSVQGWDQIESNLQNAIQSVMSGSQTPKAALDTAAKYANAVLARYNK